MADPRANELEFHDELPLRRISVAENHVHSPEIADKALQLEPVDGEFGAAAQSPTAEASWPGIIPRLPASASVVVVRWGAAAWSPLEYISPNVRQWGYEAEEFLSGQRIFESIIHEQDRKPADEPPHWARIGDSILSDRALYRIVTRTGEWRWVLDVSVAETGKSGEVRTAHGFLLDLTEQVRSGAETEMRARELTYRDERLQRLLAREKRQTRLLAAIGDIQSQLIAGENPLAVFEVLLDAFVRLTDSEYGFVGEWLHDDQGAPYLRTCAISNKAWNDYTRRLFEEQQATLEFHNLQTLIGAVLRDGRPVVSNDPATDARRGGLPLGHPALHSFLGLPLSHGTELVGIVGIANRAGGYSDDLVEFLRPLMHTGGHMIAAARLDARRREAEAVIQRRERILAAVRFAAHRLLRDADWRSCVPDILEQLAKATGSSRAYLFENHYDGQQRLLTSQTAEWVAEGVIPQIGNPQLQDVPWVEAGLERWLSKMARGEAVWGRVAELGAAERTLLEPQGIVSPAAVPVFAFGHFWGLIGFDDCIEPRLWSTSELDALNAAADVLGAAVERKRSEELLHQRSAELAHVVRLATTGEMVAEITHEIRQPLFSIMNFAQAATREMAKPGGGNKADVAQGLHRIQQSVARADSIL
ncbi:MAG: GAF domain-containing protein, partial [Pirellulaceae bacterium]